MADLARLTALAEAVADRYCERFSAPRDAGFALMKPSEEMGELTGTWLQVQGQGRGTATRQDLSNELADVLDFLLVFAARERLDPAAALRENWGKYLPPPETE